MNNSENNDDTSDGVISININSQSTSYDADEAIDITNENKRSRGKK